MVTEFLQVYDLRYNRLAILNTDNRDSASNIIEEHTLNGISTLSFEIPLSSDKWQYIINENLIKWKDEYYKIKNPTFAHSTDSKKLTVQCKHLAVSLMQKLSPSFNEIGQDANTLMDLVLTNTGWTKGIVNIDPTIFRALQTQEQSVFTNLVKIAELFEGMLLFNSLSLTVDLIGNVIDRGTQIRTSKNLQDINLQYDSDSFVITKIEPLGGTDDNGLQVNILDAPSNTTGKSYIINYNYYLNQGYTIDDINLHPELFGNEIIWNANDYVDAEMLYQDALKKLEKVSIPKVSCTLKAVDLSKIPMYKTEQPLLGETIHIYDKDLKANLDAKVIRLKINNDKPTDMEIEISNIIEYNSIMKTLMQTSNVTKRTTTGDGQISGTYIKDATIDNAKIKSLDAGKIKTGKMKADFIEGGTLVLGGLANVSGSETIKDDTGKDIIYLNKDGIQVIDGKIVINDANGTLILDAQGINADSITTGKISADFIQGGTLILGGLNNVSGSETIKDDNGNDIVLLNKDGITVNNGKVKIIDNNGTTILDGSGINASTITVGTIDAGKISVINLNADNITTGTLNAKVIGANSITADKLVTNIITAGSSLIADSAIGNAKISDLNADKLNAGTIDTSLITIQGQNARMKLFGNRLQVFDMKPDSTLYERVSIGDVNGDGTVYGFRVRGADGTTILYDENGVNHEGITDGAVSDNNVANDANINGTKLNIASVVTEINGGTTTIDSSKVLLTNTTLDIEFQNIKDTQTAQGTDISNNASAITQNANEIALKVDNQTYTNYTTANDTNITGIKDRLTTNEASINVLNNEIALKADSSTVTNLEGQVNGIDIRLTSAEEKITPDAIISTVTSSETYKSNILVPNYTDMVLTRNGLSLNPLHSYNYTNEAIISNNVIVSIFDDVTENLIYTANIEIVNNRITTFNDPALRIENAESKITQNADNITSTVTQIDNLNGRLNTAESNITQNANNITSTVTQVNSIDGRLTTAESSITQNANNINLKVDKNGVISSINQTAESITIQANKIGLLGETNIPDLTADKIKGGNLILGATNSNAELQMEDTNGNIVIDASVDPNGFYNFRALDSSGNTRTKFGQYDTNKYGLAVYNQYNELVTSSERPPASQVNGIGVGGCSISLSNIQSGISYQSQATEVIHDQYSIKDYVTVVDASGFLPGNYVAITYHDDNTGTDKIDRYQINTIIGNTLEIDTLQSYITQVYNVYQIYQPKATLSVTDGFVITDTQDYKKVSAQNIQVTLSAPGTDLDGMVWYVAYLDSDMNLKVQSAPTNGNFYGMKLVGGEPVIPFDSLPDTSGINGTVIGAILSGISHGYNFFSPNLHYIHQIYTQELRKQIPYYVNTNGELIGSFSDYIDFSDTATVSAYDYYISEIPIGENKKTVSFTLKGVSGYGMIGQTGLKDPYTGDTTSFSGMSKTNTFYMGDYSQIAMNGNTVNVLTGVDTVDGVGLGIADIYIKSTSNGKALKLIIYNKNSSNITMTLRLKAHAY